MNPLPSVLRPASGHQHLNPCLNGSISCDAVVHFLRRYYDVKLTHTWKKTHTSTFLCWFSHATARDFFPMGNRAARGCVSSMEGKVMNINVSHDCYIFHYHTHAYTLLSLEKKLADIMHVKVERTSQSILTLPVKCMFWLSLWCIQKNTHSHMGKILD